MVKIINIESGSIAEELGLKPGFSLIKINGREINDRLDYRYYITDEKVELLVRREDEETLYEIEKDADDQLGITLEDMKLKSCGNNCVFCFVYQNPKGMRKPLYFKDEDYRFSFLYGHYVTMTTVKQKDLNRIVEQRLSPLYISVHATEEKVRKLLLGINFDDHLLEKIKFLTSYGIELHAQIVLCPEINDGPVFRKTVNDLKEFYPKVRSIAVVPLGLTRYRNNLMEMRMHSKQELGEALDTINMFREELRAELGDPFVYPADEFFIRAGRALPQADYYGAFYQIENGVGEFRDMIDAFETEKTELAGKLNKTADITWVSGELAAPLLDEYIIEPLRRMGNFNINLIPVKNEFYGPSIQVSGLLTAQDIFDQLKERSLGDMVFLPPRVLNEDGFFLDDWTVEKLEQKLGVICYVYTESFSALPQVIESLLQGRHSKRSENKRILIDD